jgi:hypothetical protein
MKREMPVNVFVAWAAVVCAVIVLTAVMPRPGYAQAAPPPFPPPTTPCTPAAPPSIQPANSTYNPYPPGILPSDIVAEIARVRCEVNFIENIALGESQALGPLIFQGNPPILQGNGKVAVQILGKLMNFR